MTDGVITAEVIDRLSTWLPAMRTVPDRTRVTPRQLFSLITVESVCIVAQRKLADTGRPVSSREASPGA
jgi:hypothetical protein